eukprot:45241_1
MERTNTDVSKSDLDPTQNKLIQQSQFYITYRDSLGNYKKVFPIVMGLVLPLFIFLLDILPLIILGFNAPYSKMHTILFKSIHIFSFLVIFLVILNLIHRIGQISDKYGIGQELKRLNICFALFILLGRIIELVIIGTLTVHIYAFEFIASICSMLSILCALYIGSYLVLRRLFMDFLNVNTLRRMEDDDKQECLLNIVTMCVNIQVKKSITQNKMEANRLTLNQVLSSKLGFETFTQFLISELSVENILFLVEVKQYKACCRRYHREEHGSPVPHDAKEDTERTMNTTKPLAQPAAVAATLRFSTTTKSKPNVFKSHSVMEVDYIPTNTLLQSLGPYEYALYLYHKYVAESDLQINIPSKTRKQLTKFMIKTDKTEIILMDDYTDQMFRLYDRAWEQIESLMKSDSFLRFRKTKEYEDVCLHTQKEKEKELATMRNNGGDAMNELVLKPMPSILDWPGHEHKNGETGAITGMPMHEPMISTAMSIPETEEVEPDDFVYDDDLEKLNSIAKYDTERTEHVQQEMRTVNEMNTLEEQPADEFEQFAMDLLDDIDDYQHS